MARRSPHLSSPHRCGPACGSAATPRTTAPSGTPRHPTPLPLQNPFQCAPALDRAEPLQRRSPGRFKPLIAARTITPMAEKIFSQALIVMTLACLRRAPGLGISWLVAGSVRFVAGVSPGHSPTAGTAAGSSIVTTAALAPGTPRCNTAPSHAPGVFPHPFNKHWRLRGRRAESFFRLC